MKRLCLLLILSVSLLLCACADEDAAEKYESFRASLNSEDSLAFSSDIRCEYPDKSLEFSLYYEANDDGSTVRVLKPEIISGNSVSFGPDGATLNCNQLSIETGKLDEYGLSPMSALPSLSNIMKDGFVDSCWQEAELAVYELSLNEHLKAHIWFNNLVTVPLKAEIISGDSVKVFCSINNWQKIME